MSGPTNGSRMDGPNMCVREVVIMHGVWDIYIYNAIVGTILWKLIPTPYRLSPQPWDYPW